MKSIRLIEWVVESINSANTHTILVDVNINGLRKKDGRGVYFG